MFRKIVFVCVLVFVIAATLTEAQNVHTLPYRPDRNRNPIRTLPYNPRRGGRIRTLPNHRPNNSGRRRTMRVRRDVDDFESFVH